MKVKRSEEKTKKKGPVIPPGTEQETGLTRGQTEKPGAKKNKGNSLLKSEKRSNDL
jgi:hypothetical protein